MHLPTKAVRPKLPLVPKKKTNAVKNAATNANAKTANAQMNANAARNVSAAMHANAKTVNARKPAKLPFSANALTSAHAAIVANAQMNANAKNVKSNNNVFARSPVEQSESGRRSNLSFSKARIFPGLFYFNQVPRNRSKRYLQSAELSLSGSAYFPSFAENRVPDFS